MCRRIFRSSIYVLIVVPLVACPPTTDPPADNMNAPSIESAGVYRAYPGFAIALPIVATDADGDTLTYMATKIPDGAVLDSSTGVVSWTPMESQVGPAYVQATVTDDGTPPMSSDVVLVFQIAPLDDCVTSDCDPATGCVYTVLPIDEECCATPRETRIAEPDAPCPEGRVLHVGTNGRGFGRLQNCDLFRVAAFAQGGANASFHLETRCMNVDEEVTIDVRLATADTLLFETSRTAVLQTRPDGFSQVLGLNFQLDFTVDPIPLEGQAALLNVTMTDADGVSVSRDLRLNLTLDQVPDFPNADLRVAPAGEVGCMGCHRPTDPVSGLRVGIEDPHPWTALSCTDCHGGNNEANTFEGAHVFPESGSMFIKDLAYDKLNEVPLDYVQFVNPGDLRVAARSCGSGSPAESTMGCHQELVDSISGSVMATYAGHYKLPRFMVGSQDREAAIAAVDVVDPFYDPETAPVGTVGSLVALREPTELDRSSMHSAMDVYLAKSCATCHLSDFGPNDGPGKYRSSGCTACHMVYDDDGISRSDDPAIAGFFPPHPIKHELTLAIPAEQCAHCHFQGGRIGLSFRGIREGGFSDENTPPNVVEWGRSIYGHGPEFYFTDEDSTQPLDETPPDLHFEAGMVCADCHIGSDVHGDGYIYASQRDQVGVRCEDCHGTVREAILEDPVDGEFKNAKGHSLRHLRREDTGIFLDLANEDYDLFVPQVFDRLQSGTNPRMVEAMGVNERGYSHTDSMECYTCHNSWRQTCVGCHVRVNDDQTQYNRTTGEVSQGRISVSRDDFAIDFFAMGINDRGKMTPLCSSMSLFMSYIANGRLEYRDQVRVTPEGANGFGWNPFHHHTTSRSSPMNCDSCHPSDSIENPSNADKLNDAYGFGSGRFIGTDGDGNEYDLSAFLDAEGNLTSTFPHPRTGPVPADVRERALAIIAEPHPR